MNAEVIRKVSAWIDDNGLFLVALALSLFAAGIEGEYIGGWMPAWLFWSGYVVNLLGDIAALVLARWYGRLVQANRAHADKVLWGEFVTIGYSLFFSWRQLRGRLYLQETAPMMAQFNVKQPWLVTLEVELVALVSASFVPVVNGFLGFAQSLRDGRATSHKTVKPAQAETVELAKPAQVEPQPAQELTQLPAATIESWRKVYRSYGNNGSGFVTVAEELAQGDATLAQAEEQVLREWLKAAGLSAQVSATSLRSWRKEARAWCKLQQ